MKIMALFLFLSTTSLTASAQNQKDKRTSVKVSVEVAAPIQEAFDYIVPVDLAHIMRGYKNLPAVVSTSNQEVWNTPGMSRTIYFEDGTTAEEKLLAVNPHADFSYEVYNFSSMLRRLATKVEGKWTFQETPAGKTYIEWTYTLIPKHGLARFVLNVFVKKQVEALLNQALMILKEDLA